MDSIIYQLNSEGIDLRETRLNLIHQGYEDVWEHFLGGIFIKNIRKLIIEKIKQDMEKL